MEKLYRIPLPQESPTYQFLGWVGTGVALVAFVVVMAFPMQATVVKVRGAKTPQWLDSVHRHTLPAEHDLLRYAPPIGLLGTLLMLSGTIISWRRIRRLPVGRGPHGERMYPGVRERKMENVFAGIIFTLLLGFSTWCLWAFS